MAQPRKKRKTSIRTAAGTAQKAFSDRLRALRDDPLRVLPDCPHGEPKPVARVRAGLERVAAGKKAGFLMRRDKGVVGAVVQSIPLAQQESFPRLIDHKVGGQRRFFLQRGHVTRTCMLGVQNHDDPRSLLMAYRGMAKEHGLHFFAGDRVTCTGEVPRPPQDFIDRLADKSGISLGPSGDGGWTCPHEDAPRVRLGFRGGPSILLCGACGATAGNLHGRIRTRYAGPRERHPVEVDVVIAGQRLEPPAERLAAYRGGVEGERHLIEPVERTWRERVADEVRFVLGGRDFGGDQEAFLDALGAEGWMRDALRAMTRTGHVSRSDRLGSVLEENAGNVVTGARVFLGDDAPDFVASRAGLSVDAVLRQAHDEAEGRKRIADLPDLTDLGPVGAAMDDWARAVRRDGRAAGLDKVRRSAGRLPPPHRYAMLAALGGDPSLEHGFDADAREAGGRLTDNARRLLEASGGDYRTALRTYLERAGVGETA